MIEKEDNVRQRSKYKLVLPSIYVFVVSLIILLGSNGQLQAQTLVKSDQMPVDLKDVGLDEKLAAQVDPNLTFTDESGNTVALKDYFGRLQAL